MIVKCFSCVQNIVTQIVVEYHTIGAILHLFWFLLEILLLNASLNTILLSEQRQSLELPSR
jgi:hypothetical protein